jgi:tyrosyl-tRNA synthetase
MAEWQARGLLQDHTPDLNALLEGEPIMAYSGFDPTADSLHVGNLVPITVLAHLQRAGHKVIALVGGATGMIGDPSGKSAERNLLDEATLRRNEAAIRGQLERFLDFEGDNPAILVNNYDWFKEMAYLEFIRDVGKHITINYMLAKESVKKRLESGMSFTEFTYQLAQGYDYLHLYREYGCKLQVGGSDQWGNITTGTELVRKIDGGEAEAMTFPLITKADGSKFGKSEQGNVWLSAERTSPYQFYQFWLNVSDEEAIHYLRVYTFIPLEEIAALAGEHAEAPQRRLAQTRLAETLTERVHGAEALAVAQRASGILFGKSTKDDLLTLDAATLLDVFSGVPRFDVPKGRFAEGVNLVDLITEFGIMASRGEVRRALKENSLALNKEKGLTEERLLGESDLLQDQFLLLQRGKKQYFLVVAV